MYKLIASDMDGTLLRSDRTISEKTVNTIRSLKQKGVKFVLSTGRPLVAVEKYNELLELNGPAIIYNGAQIYDFASKKIIFEKYLDFADAKFIWDEGLKRNVEMYLWAENVLYTNLVNDRIYEYTGESRAAFKKLENINEISDKKVTKIIWDDSGDIIEKYVKELDEIGFYEKVNYCSSMLRFLEFFNKDTSKKVAIQKLEEIYNITKDEIIAIGDGNNDIEMISYAGLGVAMGNADDKVKSIAKIVTTTNDEEGVLNVIDKYVL